MTPVSDNENLQAYFDGELGAEERAAFEAALAGDPEARLNLEELALLREAIVGSLEAEAAAVPEARFEQIWDEVDRTLDRDARLQQAADVNVSIWSRMAAFFRPVWAPTLGVAAAAAAIALYVGGGDSQSPENTPTQVASKDGPPAEEAAPAPKETAPAPAPADEGLIAAKVDDALPANSEAEIQRIEFGGKTGRIDRIESKQGITTVIWISEDDETTDSERSL
ncbi:MAG: zf-HC2 domain-containing protein [Myxococcales bacterium]|nr:zf-HC2 domain-containing protein [Myxococcales bacterium]